MTILRAECQHIREARLEAGAGYTLTQIGAIARMQGRPQEARKLLEKAPDKLRSETSPVAEDSKATIKMRL